MADESGRKHSAVAGWLAVLAAAVGLTAFFLMGSSHMLLDEPDEARCALIARHMIDSGDWLAPYLVDHPYFDKPPLFFWMLAGCMKAFPGCAWALRLAPAFICAVTVVLTGVLAAQFFNRRAGLFAAATFAVSIAALMGSRVIRMDMLLATWVTAALICWSRACIVGRSRGWYIAMYVCMALGCLTKGPVAVLLPAMMICLYLVLEALQARRRQTGASAGPDDAGPVLLAARRSLLAAISSMHIPLGVLIVTVIYGSWVAYMTWRYPQYLNEFFVRQNLDRFAGSGLGIVSSRLTVLGSYIGGLMPWTALMALASWQLRPRRGMPAAEKFLWIWGLTVIVFFSLSKAQLPNYVLPAFPSTFALLGAYLAGGDRYPRQIRLGLVLTFLLAAGTLIGWPIAEKISLGQTNLPLAAVRIAGLPVLAAGTWWLWRRGPQAALLPFLLGCVLITAEIAYGPGPRILASRSCAALAEPLSTLDPSVGPVIITTEPRYGVIYYAPRDWKFRVLDMKQAMKELPPLLAADRDLYAVMTGGGMLDALTGAGAVGLEIHGQPIDLSDRLTILARLNRDVFVRIRRPTVQADSRAISPIVQENNSQAAAPANTPHVTGDSR